MKKLKLLSCLVVAIFGLISCNKNESYRVTFPKTGFYFKWGGSAQTVSYSKHNITAVEVTSVSEGWTCVVNAAANTVTITPPEDPNDDEKRESMRTGTANISAVSEKGNSAKYVLTFHILDNAEVNLNENGEYANCYVVSTPYALYTFDAKVAGSGSKRIDTASVELLWQSRSGMIQHLSLNDDGKAAFFIDRLSDDDGYVMEDGKYVIQHGNAVIASRNSAGEIIWSWHIWSIRESENPLAVYDTYSNGKSYMNKNLGAFGNSNGKTDDTDDILASYGLYYQWGRKDPFVRPYYYDCANNYDERIYGSSGSAVYVRFEETGVATGTVEYAVANPMTFITNAACVTDDGDGVGDWLNTPDNSLWSDTAKSDYDPCPFGWRVPSKADFDVLSLSAEEDAKDLDTARKQFGWSLSDGQNNYFYTGAGYRSYYNGVITNMNHKDGVYPSVPEPWEGYYWTTGRSDDGKQSTCMYFDLTTTRTVNKFSLNYPSKRANAMQIRCVKM